MVTQDILKKVQVHIPFHRLRDHYLPLVLKERINPEISFSHRVLDQYHREDYREIAEQLLGAGLSITFHAPFLDLRPGSVDPRIRRVSMDRLQQVFDTATLFHPLAVVCHPAFDAKYYVSLEHDWFESSMETWRHFAAVAEQLHTIITLENVYESHPGQLHPLLEALALPHIRCCFDTGHFNAFSQTDWKLWAEQLAPFMAQLHIHDNRGTADEHLPVGEGNFPFHDFFDWLRGRGLHPIVTIEAHSERNLWETVKNIREMNLLEGVV